MGYSPISSRSDKDVLIRARRFDRINRVQPGEGDRFPVNYELQRINYLPADVEEPGPKVDGRKVASHLRSQAAYDLKRRFEVIGQDGFPDAAYNRLAEDALELARKKRDRADEAAVLLRDLKTEDLRGILTALSVRGYEGAKAELKHVFQVEDLAQDLLK